jgi:hypothetical protein
MMIIVVGRLFVEEWLAQVDARLKPCSCHRRPQNKMSELHVMRPQDPKLNI